jgi:hypothetical protein
LRISRYGRLLAFALLWLSGGAWAQRVVVLEVEGDRGNHLREQVESALKKAGAVEILSIRRYKEGASKKHLKGARAMTPSAVAQVSRVVPFEAAVGGTLADTFFVRILDPGGQELWSKDLPLRSGLLSSDNARRLAKAIAAAAATVSTTPPAVPSVDAAAPPETAEVDAPVIRTPQRGGAQAEAAMPGLDVSHDDTESHVDVSAEGRDTDLEAEFRRRPPRVAPKLVLVQLTGTTTWRSYCARPGPGVTSCAQYDALTNKPPGDTVDFSPQVPYAGVGVTGEGFPLQGFDNLLKGLGVGGSYSRGYSLTNVQVQSTGGSSPTSKQVVSTDESYYAMGLYRYYFSYGEKKDPLVGYAGIRGGLVGRTFNVDPTAEVPLPGSHRQFGAIGVDALIPIIKLLKVDARALYYINPAPGPDEVVGYGQSATGQGFEVDGGVSGDIWGPFGYVLRFTYQQYHDTFVGQGNKWSNGGVAQETYSGLYWGASAQF